MEGIAKRDLHGERVYLRVWSESEALASFQTEPPIAPDDLSPIEAEKDEARSEELTEMTPDLMPMTIHSEDGSHVHGLLLQRNRRIEHPMTIAIGDEEEYTSLVGKVSRLAWDICK